MGRQIIHNLILLCGRNTKNNNFENQAGGRKLLLGQILGQAVSGIVPSSCPWGSFIDPSIS
jgi:hypothetical protein